MKKIFTIVAVLISLAERSQFQQTVWFGTPSAPQAHSVQMYDSLYVWDTLAGHWTLL